MRHTHALLGVMAAATAAVLTVGPASAAPTVSDPIVENLIGPLQLDATKHAIYVSQSFAGVLTKVTYDGQTEDLVTADGEIAGVAYRGGDVAYTFTNFEKGIAKLKIRRADGSIATVANLHRFEKRNNPDAGRTYGLTDLGPRCEVAEELRPHSGRVDSHPYAVENAPGGGWFVADAGANAVLRVSEDGDVKVVHVAKPQRFKVTKSAAEANGLPKCTVGRTFAAEGVPTDVERSESGKLFVSLLPGGPEDPSAGARGSVVKVNPKTDKVTKIAGGLMTATNVALHKGRVYVAELFAGKVSVINLKNGNKRTYAEVSMPSALDFQDGVLFSTKDALAEGPPFGSIVAVTNQRVTR